MNPSEICGSRGINSVETSDSFVTGLFTTLTWGIYSPRAYSIYCNPEK